jgi:N-acyl-D-aspartate/D-glutamate deacylase
LGLTQKRAWYRVEIYESRARPELRGMTVEQCAHKEGKQPEDFLIDLYLAEEGDYPALMLHYIECDVATVASHPIVIIPQTDGEVRDPAAISKGRVSLSV